MKRDNKKYNISYGRTSRKKSWRAYLGPVVASLAIISACVVYVLTSEQEPVPPAPMASAQSTTSAPSKEKADAGKKPIERTAALPPLNLPADDAPHGSGMEWWYYNGILGAKTGERYAFHVAVFVANGLIKHTVMHMALTDLQTGKRYVSQNRTGGVPAKGIANGFDFGQEGWRVSASGPSHVLRAAFDGASMALNLTDTGQAVAHRAADSETPGLLDFGASGISYYYSRPRISTQGEITVGGKPVQVSGDVWFDHQWGEFDVLTLGWNWFALHLADGSDVMLYGLFDGEGRKVMTAGTVSNAKGSTPLKASDVELTPVGTWTSPTTKIPYAVEWTVKLPSGVLNVKPFFNDSEFDSRLTSANIYWEGPVKVTGSSEGQGFLELSGYDRLSSAQANRK